MVVHGELLEFERRLDRVFVSWASEWGAEEYRFPALVKAEHLGRLDYFRSFSSGCIAFGLERWLFACVETFGPRVQDWPNPEDVHA